MTEPFELGDDFLEDGAKQIWRQHTATKRAAYEAQAVAKVFTIMNQEAELQLLRGEFRQRSDGGHLNFDFATQVLGLERHFFVGEVFATTTPTLAESLGSMKKAPWPQLVNQFFRESRERRVDVERLVGIFKCGTITYCALTGADKIVDKGFYFTPSGDDRRLLLCSLDALLRD